jgi:hypothetical protein
MWGMTPSERMELIEELPGNQAASGRAQDQADLEHLPEE